LVRPCCLEALDIVDEDEVVDLVFEQPALGHDTDLDSRILSDFSEEVLLPMDDLAIL